MDDKTRNEIQEEFDEKMPGLIDKERKKNKNKKIEREYEKVPTAVLKLYLETLEDTYNRQESILKRLGLKVDEVKREILMKTEKKKRKYKIDP